MLGSSVHAHQLNQQWRSCLRQTPTPGLRQDLDKLIQIFERVVDRKDNFIKLLVSNLSEAEQQSAQARGAHHQSLDHLLELHKIRLEALESHWNTNVKKLSTKYNIEREQHLKLQQQEIEYLKAKTQDMMLHYEEKYIEALQDYEYTVDHTKIKYAGMKHAVETRMAEQKQWYLKKQKKYICTTGEEMDDTFDLQETIKQINLNKKHMQKPQGTVDAACSHLSSSYRDIKETSDGLNDCEPIKKEIRETEAKLPAQPPKSWLANYSKHSYDTINKLQNIIQEGEVLLRLLDVCHKLEMVQEMVLPFYTSSSNAEKKEKGLEVMSEEAQTMMDHLDLEKFWQRYNEVLLECMYLDQEKKVLRLEKQQLKSLLK